MRVPDAIRISAPRSSPRRGLVSACKPFFVSYLALIWTFALFVAAPSVYRLEAQTYQDQEVKPIPVLTGGAGFITTFDAGEPHLGPLVAPVLLIPLGQRWLIESRATFESDLAQIPGQSGFHGDVKKELDYAQVDFIANRYMTITAGRFLTPFNIYNERLYPIWVRNLQTDPLTLPIGVGPSNASTGAMVRGGFQVSPQLDLNYAAYFSALCNVTPVDSSRFAGGRFGAFVPKMRLEFGGSFQHLLQGDRTNAFGFYAAWQPNSIPLDLRGEYARSQQGSGYWTEAAYRLSQVPWMQKEMRHTQLVARYQQYFTGSLPSDSLPSANTRFFEFGLNYYFFDGFRAAGSYGRQFSSEGNANIWTVGLTYRFMIPLGHAGGN